MIRYTQDKNTARNTLEHCDILHEEPSTFLILIIVAGLFFFAVVLGQARLDIGSRIWLSFYFPSPATLYTPLCLALVLHSSPNVAKCLSYNHPKCHLTRGVVANIESTA